MIVPGPPSSRVTARDQRWFPSPPDLGWLGRVPSLPPSPNGRTITPPWHPFGKAVEASDQRMR